MPEYYVYLISSLPLLNFGARPPFSFAGFLEACRGFIPQEDFLLLEGMSLLKRDYSPMHPALFKWVDFDNTLRNELTKIRAARKKIDPEPYLRPDWHFESQILHLSVNASRQPNILEAERILDQARWSCLEEISTGHFFDLDYLIVYALKLLILERWEKIRSCDPRQALISAIAG